MKMMSGEPNIISYDKELNTADLKAIEIGSNVPKYGSWVTLISTGVASALFHYRMDVQMQPSPTGAIARTIIPTDGQLFIEQLAYLIFVWIFVWINVQTTINLWKHLHQKMESGKEIIVNLQLLGLLGFIIGYWGCTIWFNVTNYWAENTFDHCCKVPNAADAFDINLIRSPAPAVLTLIILCSGAFMKILELTTDKVNLFKLNL